MSAGEPLVTILISNYNYERYLRESIDSALAQTYSRTEIIVVDDGSTDGSREIIASYGERIFPILKENGSQASTFNAGFAASHGDWIFLLDSDDMFKPAKVETVIRLANSTPEVDLIVHNLEYCDADGSPTDFLPPLIRELKVVDDQMRARGGTLTARLPATSGLCFRRKLLEQILPMPEEIRILEDGYLKFAALTLTPILQIPETLAWQRIHGRNRHTFREVNEVNLIRQLKSIAEVNFHLKKDHPSLSKLVWKQYGRILYQLASVKSESARAAKAEIMSRFSVLDRSPVALFYVAGAFTRAFLRDLQRRRIDAGE